MEYCLLVESNCDREPCHLFGRPEWMTGFLPVGEPGGRDVAKCTPCLLALTLASALCGVQAKAQSSAFGQPDFKTPMFGSALACTQPETIRIPKPLAARAKLKARLVTILRDSLYDDAKGIVNAAREREIKNLASKLRDEKLDDLASH